MTGWCPPPALIRALDDRDAVVRLRAVEALGRIGPEAEGVSGALIAALEHKDPAARRGAVEALQQHPADAGGLVPARPPVPLP